jgi:hypothetical protein
MVLYKFINKNMDSTNNEIPEWINNKPMPERPKQIMALLLKDKTADQMPDFINITKGTANGVISKMHLVYSVQSTKAMLLKAPYIGFTWTHINGVIDEVFFKGIKVEFDK